MANITINGLTTIGAIANNDEIPVWDVDAGVTRKVSRQSLVGGVISGGGTIATGGFTLTVPATGTAALLAQAQTFTALQTFNAGINLGGANLSTYEVGGWTPIIAGNSTPGSHSYTNQTGRYLKIGTLVLAWFDVQINVKDGSMAGNVDIAGLPFTVRNSIGLLYASPIGWWQNLATNIVFAGIYASINTTTARVTKATAAAASAANMAATDIQNGSRFIGVIAYEGA